jgi:hypothetical protein
MREERNLPLRLVRQQPLQLKQQGLQLPPPLRALSQLTP